MAAYCPAAKVSEEISRSSAACRWARTASRRRPHRLHDAGRDDGSSSPRCAPVGRQAGRLQALHRPRMGVPGDLQGDAADRHLPRFHRGRRQGGRHRRRALEFIDHVGMPLREGLHLRAQCPGGHRRPTSHQDRRQPARSSRPSTSHPRDGAGRRLVQRGARLHVRGRLHPGAVLPHRPMPDRGRDPGPDCASARSSCRTRPSGWRTSTAPP
jgi:hypothetical protein